MPQLDARACMGTHDVLFITIDSLRYDVAVAAMAAGETPILKSLAPDGNWEHRHTPSTFTYGAHTAFFAGFLPTPVKKPNAPRLFATAFPGSKSIGDQTLCFDQADIVTGFFEAGYATICIGGVGFFNKQSPLGSILPDLFAESWWSPKLGVTCLQSTEHQMKLAKERLAVVPADQPAFMFINIAACHYPNRGYTPGAPRDTVHTQAEALKYVDSQLAHLLKALRGPTLVVICSDHGEAYGEDGYHGHRLAHSTVWDVPYLETILNEALDHE